MNKKLKTFVTFTCLVGTGIYLTNKFCYSLSLKRNLLQQEEIDYFDWRFGKIAYTQCGTGSPVLLVHNLLPGSSSYEFHEMKKLLAKEHTVYCIDLPGYGLSDKPNLTYTNYLFVQAINDFIKNIIGKRTDLVAAGDAASFSIMCCHNDPELFRKLVFINPTSLYKLNLSPTKEKQLLKILIELPLIGTLLYNIMTSEHMLRKAFEEDYFYDKTKIADEDIYHYMEASHTGTYFSKFSFASYVSNYSNINILHALKEINNSILLLGGREVKGNKSNFENYIYYNPSIESELLNRSKLLAHLENPKLVADHVLTFLDSE